MKLVGWLLVSAMWFWGHHLNLPSSSLLICETRVQVSPAIWKKSTPRETFVSQNSINEEAITLGHILLIDTQNKDKAQMLTDTVQHNGGVILKYWV